MMATSNRKSRSISETAKCQLYYYDDNQLQECNGDYGLCDMKFLHLLQISRGNSSKTVERPRIVMPQLIGDPGRPKPKYVLWKLGQGSFGQVYKGRYEGADVAIKIFGSEKERTREANIINRMNQKSFRRVVRRVQKEEIVEQKKVFPKLLSMSDIRGQNLFCLVYELVHGVTLHTFFEQQAQYDGNTYVYLNVFKEFALCLQHIHDTCEIRHRDLKADNVMVHHDKSRGEVQVFLFPWHLLLRFIRTYIVHSHLYGEGGYP